VKLKLNPGDMNANILSVRFFVKKYKAKENIAPIYARISIDGRSVDISLKRNIDLANWNPSRGQARGNSEGVKILNTYLDKVRNEISNHYSDLKFPKKPTHAEALKNLYCGVGQKEKTLVELIKYHNGYLKDSLEWGTTKNYFTTQNYIQMFLNKRLRIKDIPLSHLSYSFLVDFEIFLKSVKPKGLLKPCGHNTILKHIERLRKMINLAMKNEWIDRDPFMKFKARFIRNERAFLSPDDLRVIETKDLSLERLQLARDLFVFSCYTGLAYSDAIRMTKQNVSIGIDREWWIMMARKKTKQPVRVPLLPKAMELIRRYSEDDRTKVTGTLFPVLSNQKLNSYLKEIAAACGIGKHLTFHLARHTFATTLTLTNGVPIETVSKMLGHANLRTTQIYAKVVEKKISDDMGRLRQVLQAQAAVWLL
jgi:integrase/recombinase XerD